MAVERYEVLRKHLPEEAAKVIAEGLPFPEQVVTKDYLTNYMDARLAQLESSMHRWVVTLMASQWLGLAAVLVAIVLKR